MGRPSPQARVSFDALAAKIREQRSSIVQAEGNEHKAKLDHEEAQRKLEEEREIQRKLAREFFAIANDEGIKPEEAKS